MSLSITPASSYKTTYAQQTNEQTNINFGNKAFQTYAQGIAKKRGSSLKDIMDAIRRILARNTNK